MIQDTRNNQTLIRLDQVAKDYTDAGHSRTVLHDVAITIERGQIVALLGKSGSGKSTLLNLISGIDQPTRGTITIDGHDLTGLSERARTLFRRRHIGFVFQFFNLIPTLTVLENVLFPLELNGVARTTGRERAAALLADVGLADRGTSYPDQLSGGEQQRVAIARALIHDPMLVLADEPTGNLDNETGRQALALLERLTRRSGKTMLVVTHSPEVAAIADRVFRLHAGHLREDTAAVNTAPPQP
jgi:putative ABC transport system ATP-binding protein